jgi:alkanesulfonate monooxygenase SsuD/methylene tetrahydromethanopterin reductase-like flavin-dependent oxidoreductase (luciferase family)
MARQPAEEAVSMEFGIFDHLDRTEQPLHDHYEARLKIVEAYDRAGFYSYHLAEHHFTPLGMAPSPSVFLAAAAQRTDRLRLGTMVYALPLHHPLRVVEEICMLDQMSGGRVDIGFGRGSVPFEVAFYGQDADRRQDIYAERVELVLKAFTERTLSFAGKYDRFDNVPMEITPLQKPHPPVWYGAHSPDSAMRAARKGFNIINNDVPAITLPTLARFREIWREVFGTVGPVPKAGVVRFIVVADSDAAAVSAARRAYPRWLQSFNYLYRMHNASPGLGERPPNFDVLMERGLGVAGKPETVIAYLAPQLRDCGTNYLVGHMCFGDLALDEALRSIELFGREVMPALRA